MASTDALVADLRQRCRGEVEADAPLDGHTTLRVGGTARALVTATSLDDLVAIGEACAAHEAPALVIGRGSNLLVADAGWPGVVIVLGDAFTGYEIDGNRVHAGGAEMLPVLSVRLSNEGFVGFAWASAVPGSLGGAVRMNAGAHGSELAEFLVSADLFRLDSRQVETWGVDELGLSYRHSELPPDAVVIRATLELERGETEVIREEIREIKQWRRDHQPVNEPNCGSVFTNPEGDSAGRLVDAAGAKGLRVGGAQVSPKHANFIVTDEGATASDVRALIRRVRHRVAEEFGVELRPEVVMVGDFGDDNG